MHTVRATCHSGTLSALTTTPAKSAKSGHAKPGPFAMGPKSGPDCERAPSRCKRVHVQAHAPTRRQAHREGARRARPHRVRVSFAAGRPGGAARGQGGRYGHFAIIVAQQLASGGGRVLIGKSLHWSGRFSEAAVPPNISLLKANLWYRCGSAYRHVSYRIHV